MKYNLLALAIAMGLMFFSSDVSAQCAMCKMVAENGAKADGGPVLGLNQGILYLAAFPYLAFMTIAFLFWRGYKRKKKEETELLS
jgi:TRAP-type C4-dicarboxylate transport system permease small subunit